MQRHTRTFIAHLLTLNPKPAKTVTEQLFCLL